jgi:hypothetical protein
MGRRHPGQSGHSQFKVGKVPGAGQVSVVSTKVRLGVEPAQLLWAVWLEPASWAASPTPMASDMAVGAPAGAVLVGALGYGVAAGTMSPVTLCSVLLAPFFGMIGPGCDDYKGTAPVPAAVNRVVNRPALLRASWA